jgi:hypothetical protein
LKQPVRRRYGGGVGGLAWEYCCTFQGTGFFEMSALVKVLPGCVAWILLRVLLFATNKIDLDRLNANDDDEYVQAVIV